MTAVDTRPGKVRRAIVANRLHILVLAPLLTIMWDTTLQLGLDWQYYVMIACTTASGYAYNQVTDRAEDALNYDQPAHYLGRHPRVAWAVVVATTLVAIIIAAQVGWWFVLYGSVVNVVMNLYSTPLPGPSRGRRFKDVAEVKNFYAALCWSLPLVLTAHLYAGRPSPLIDVIPIVLITFFIDFVSEILWDIRDIDGDQAAGVRTLANAYPPAVARNTALAGVGAVTALYLFGLLFRGFAPIQGSIFLVIWVPYMTWSILRFGSDPDKEAASHRLVLVQAAILVTSLAVQVIVHPSTFPVPF